MRVGVLGCGSIGQRHLRNLRTLARGEVLAYEPEPGTRERVAELGVRVVADLEAVWDWRPDCVLVTAPSQYHVPLAHAAAERGCHLFVEKPLSHDDEGVAALCDEAERRGLTTMVACNMRFHPGPARIYQLLGDGAIGRVLAGRVQTGSYLPRWRPAQDHRQSYSASPVWGGAILDCIHELDLATWYFGPARLLAAVSVPAASIGLETDGLAELLLRHEGGTISSVHLNFVQRDYRRTCQVIGERGTISWDFESRRVVIYGEDGRVAAEHEQGEWEVNQMYLDELSHFLDAVERGGATMNPLAAGRATLRIALEARRGAV